MAELLIYRKSSEAPVVLVPADGDFFLDRKFLTGSNSDDRYSARHAPLIFPRVNGWYVHNRLRDTTLVLKGPGGNICRIGPDMTRLIEQDYSELLICECWIGLEIRGPLENVIEPPIPDGPITNPQDGGAERALLALLESKPLLRTIMYVRFQEYISDDPVYARRPQPLTAAEVLECFPDGQNIGAVHQAWREIHEVLGISLSEMGPWLVERGILLSTHNIEIPHVNCPHRINNKKS
jgi:hypothetical protein